MSELTPRARWRRLNAIRQTVANDERGAIAPRALAALCASAATFVLAVLVLPLGVAWLELGALCAAAGVFYLVHTRSSFAASWRDRLDAQLASYEPLDRGAFEVLQRQATAPGGLDNLHVLAWLSVEREAVRPSAAAPRPWRFAERAGP